MPWPVYLEYVNFRQSTHVNYHHIDTDFNKLMAQAIKFVQQDLPTSVLNARDDARSLLELSVRQWTGFGALQDKTGAIATWIALASSRDEVPLSLKARACSCLAKAWLDRAQESGPGTMNVGHLYHAGNSANQAAALGLISPMVLQVASAIESTGLRRPDDNRFPEHSTERFERLTDLWEAWDVRTVEIAEEEQQREAKASKDPLSYFCAAEDCWIVARKKSALRRCGGGCPPVFKPSYCSKDCQKADWKHHRPFCNPDATESSVLAARSTNVPVRERRPNPPEDTRSEGVQPGPERGVGVDLGGETVQLPSTTQWPDISRGMKENLKQMARENPRAGH